MEVCALMNRLTDFLITLFFLLVFVAPQSFSFIKLPILGFILLYVLLNILFGKLKIYSFDAINYYFFISLISLVWILIGVLNDNNVTALYDAFRLFVVYNAIYILLLIYITNRNFYKNVLPIISIAAILIALIAFYTVIDQVYNLESIPLVISHEMFLLAGIHSGYTELGNINIGMYSFLLPFLLSFIIMDGNKKNKLTYFALFISVLAVILASRRMIIFLIILVPFLCLIIDLFITTKLNLKIFYKVAKIYLPILMMLCLVFLLSYYFDMFDTVGFSERITDALIYNENSVRQTQFKSLIDGFYENPIMGSGFGGEASVIRSADRPWNYELTYPKVLFHAGIIGVLFLVTLFSYYTFKSLKLCVKNKRYYSINVSLMVGFVSVLIASASNPYMNSFDYLFILAIPPLIISLVKKDKFYSMVYQNDS